MEDDEHEREWLRATLSEAGYQVDTAATGAEAIALSRGRRYQAVTLDLLLPDDDGREVLKALRAHGANTETPVIVVTVVAESGILAGFDVQQIFTKPISEADLVTSVARAGVAKDHRRPILVVDDDPNTLKIAEATLLSAGYRPVCRSDAASALRAALEADGRTPTIARESIA